MSLFSSESCLWWLAWRQVLSRRGRGISFMTIMSVFGITVGVAALVIVLSVMGGFERNLREKMFRGLPHIEIRSQQKILGFSLQKNPLSDFEAKGSNLLGLESFTESDVVLRSHKNLAPITLIGLEPNLGGGFWGFKEGMIAGSLKNLGFSKKNSSKVRPQIPGIILGERLVYQLNIDLGDEVQVLNPQVGAFDVLSGQAPTTVFQLVGVFLTDLTEYDSRYGVVSLESGRKFLADYDPSLDEQEYISGIAINLKDPLLVDQYVKQLNGLKEKGLLAETWKNVNSSLLSALKLEKLTMAFILLLIVLVASFSISGTMMMSVYYKRSQIALLRCLGLNRVQIRRLFFLKGFVIATLGVFLGLSLGLIICYLIPSLHTLVPNSLAHGGKLPVRYLPLEYGVICLSAWILSLFAVIYPATVAMRQPPGVGLRYL